jgi:threonine/homoserine/homoserine lactone efflux protein
MLGNAIGGLLPFAVGVAVSPMPIVAVVLMLVTPKARTNGSAFVLGWIVGIAVAGAIVLLIAVPTSASSDGQPANWVNWLKLALGLILLLVAVRQWRARPHEGEPSATPKWMAALDGFTAMKAAGTGVLLSAANPKNLVFIIGGGAAVAQTGISTGDQILAWAIFTAIATIGVGAPVVLYFTLGDRAAAPLDALKDWMARNNTAIMAVLCLIIGAKLIGDAISGFST